MLSFLRVEKVFDAVVRTARQVLCNFCPLVSIFLVVFEDKVLLFETDVVLGDRGVEVVMPSAEKELGVMKRREMCKLLVCLLTSRDIACPSDPLFRSFLPVFELPSSTVSSHTSALVALSLDLPKYMSASL